MQTYVYTVDIELEDGVFVVSVPALPGCFTYGRTFNEAMRNAEECIAGFIETLQQVGEPVPEEEQRARKVALRVEVGAPAGV